MTRIPNVRVAIAGAGLMGRAHARASVRAGGRIVSIADTDIRAAADLASVLGRNVSHGSVDEMLRPEKVDVVHVCTPPGQHVEVCVTAVERGIHVLCEKPLANDADETQNLFNLARERGVIVCPVHQFPFQRGAAEAVAHLTSLGRIRWITGEMCTAGATTIVESLHDQMLLDILPHPLSLICAFLGGPLADGRWNGTRAEKGEILVSGTLRGTGVAIALSTHGRPTSSSMRLIGERGTITLDLFHGFSFFEAGRVSRVRKLLRPFVSSGKKFAAASVNASRRAVAGESAFPGLTELCRRFYLAADNRADSPVSPAEAVDIAMARDTISASLATQIH